MLVKWDTGKQVHMTTRFWESELVKWVFGLYTLDGHISGLCMDTQAKVVDFIETWWYKTLSVTVAIIPTLMVEYIIYVILETGNTRVKQYGLPLWKSMYNNTL